VNTIKELLNPARLPVCINSGKIGGQAAGISHLPNLAALLGKRASRGSKIAERNDVPVRRGTAGWTGGRLSWKDQPSSWEGRGIEGEKWGEGRCVAYPRIQQQKRYDERYISYLESPAKN